MRKWRMAAGAALVTAVVATSAVASAAGKAAGATVKRGEYLVTIGSCNDCHTPAKMGPNGPEPDLSRLLSGHPADMQLPPAPKLEAPWLASVTATMTAWSGPWGVSYTANLTPDPETGLGKWSEQNFVEAMRTGRHMGRGRPILPPMPVAWIGKMTTQDLKAVFAYLKSIPPIQNRVPDPTPPAGPPAAAPSQAGSK